RLYPHRYNERVIAHSAVAPRSSPAPLRHCGWQFWGWASAVHIRTLWPPPSTPGGHDRRPIHWVSGIAAPATATPPPKPNANVHAPNDEQTGVPAASLYKPRSGRPWRVERTIGLPP